MSLKAEVEEIETALKGANVPLDVVLADAGVDRSTWTRWKSGVVTGARYDTWSRVKTAASEALNRSAA